MEHPRGGQLEFDLEQCDERREPAMPVTVRFLDEWHDAELYGWAADLRGPNDGWRGLFFGVREVAPGFLTWVRAEKIQLRPG